MHSHGVAKLYIFEHVAREWAALTIVPFNPCKYGWLVCFDRRACRLSDIFDFYDLAQRAILQPDSPHVACAQDTVAQAEGVLAERRLRKATLLCNLRARQNTPDRHGSKFAVRL